MLNFPLIPLLNQILACLKILSRLDKLSGVKWAKHTELRYDLNVHCIQNLHRDVQDQGKVYKVTKMFILHRKK